MSNPAALSPAAMAAFGRIVGGYGDTARDRVGLSSFLQMYGTQNIDGVNLDEVLIHALTGGLTENAMVRTLATAITESASKFAPGVVTAAQAALAA